MFSLLGSAWADGSTLRGSRPNIIFLITDDQGYGDLSAHGNPVLKTPNLDALRARSLRFTDFMVSPTCAPTRSAIQSGRHEFKNGVTHTILERERMSLKTVTIAQVLAGAGYQNGIFGKWHLGDEEAYRPLARGFSRQFIHGGGGIGQSYPGSCGDAPNNNYFDPVILDDRQMVQTKGYCTDVFFAEAMKWIGQVHAKGPFYCHLATNAPHGPYIARPEDRRLYEGRGLGEDTENFFGMLHNIDENLGRLVGHLKALGIENETLLIFMNDNGGTAGVKVFNAGMRGAKGSPWIGGTRANSFWCWPGRIAPADCPALTAHIDVFRSWASLAGAQLDEVTQRQVEGRDLLPLLSDPKAAWDDRELFTHVGRWPKGEDWRRFASRNASIRTQRWQLVSEAPNSRGKGKAVASAVKQAAGKSESWQLFDLQADPAQTKDVAAANPEVVDRLKASYQRWWLSLEGLVDENEKVVGPALNPFAELFWKQFGGGPSPEDLRRMDGRRAFEFERVGGRKN